MKEKLPFIIYIGIGAVLMAASLPHMDGYYGNMVFWVGFGTVCAESVQLLKYCWWRAPAHKDAYEAKRQEAHINAVDERKQMLRMRAGYLVNQLMFWILLGLDFVLALLKAPAWPHTVCAVDLPVHRGGRDLPPPGKTAVREVLP